MASISRTLRFAALIRPSAVLSVVPRAATVGCLHTLTSRENRLSNTALLSAITKVMLSTAGAARRRQRVYSEDQLIIPCCLLPDPCDMWAKALISCWLWILYIFLSVYILWDSFFPGVARLVVCRYAWGIFLCVCWQVV